LTVSGELFLTFGDGRPAREGAGLVSGSRQGLTWELRSEGTGVVRWDDITGWTSFDMAESRRFRSARRRTQLKISTADGGTLMLLADSTDAADLTRQAQHALPGGTVERTQTG
jgi:hypothetical protein